MQPEKIRQTKTGLKERKDYIDDDGLLHMDVDEIFKPNASVRTTVIPDSTRRLC